MEIAQGGIVGKRDHLGWLSGKRILGMKIATWILVAILILAAVLRFYDIQSIGDGNTYYTAAVESMLQSWKNFFFAAAEPGGSVTVDKPPLGLWLQAISAFFLGVNGFAVTLPQILAGILSVALLYHLVRRYFDEGAGLLAALLLAIAPVAIATDRNNTMDSTLTFTLLLAAWAYLQAADRGKLRWLMLGGLLVGLAFNIKMLQAFLPLPAFYALYFLGSRERWPHKLFNLFLSTILLLAVSLSWAVIVDLIPADERPYIGSSEDNTVMELIMGHNGLNRLLGGNRGNPGQDGQLPTSGPIASGDDMPMPPANGAQFGGLPQPGQTTPGQGGFPPMAGPPPAGQVPPAMPGQATKRPAAGAPGGNGEIGEPGVLRLFSQPLANEIAWLLPFGLFSIALVAVRERVRLPLSDKHKGLVLWGGYLLTAGVFFSIAEFYHAYYLVMMAAPLAALVAMGVSELWNMGRERPALAIALLAFAGIGTIAVQVFIAYKYVESAPWLVLVFGLLTLSGLMLLFSTKARRRIVWKLSATCLVASMLVTPMAWSVLTATDDSPNINLPSAYQGGVDERAPVGDRRRVNQELLEFLQANTQDVEYLVAVRSSMEGAGMVLETGRPVLYMGGFNGQDPVVSAEDLAQMAEDGELRYVLWGGANRNAKQSAEIGNWLQSNCVAVEGAGLKQVAQPVPGRTFLAGSNGPPDGPQTGQTVLYHCGE